MGWLQVLLLTGMGGVGKTTLARVLFRVLCPRFARCCFVEATGDARAAQGVILRQLCAHRHPPSSDTNGRQHLLQYLGRGNEMLLVLDNLWDLQQADRLLPDSLQLPPGSIVIVTSRHSQAQERMPQKLQGCRDHWFTVTEMSQDSAKQLLTLHASLGEADEQLVDQIVQACHGSPLVLTVVGVFLHHESSKMQAVSLFIASWLTCHIA